MKYSTFFKYIVNNMQVIQKDLNFKMVVRQKD